MKSEQVVSVVTDTLEDVIAAYAPQELSTVPSYVNDNIAALATETPEQTLQAMQQLGYNVEEVQG